MPASLKTVVDVLTEGLGVVLPEALGSLHGIQAMLVRLRQGDVLVSEHVVALAHHPRLSDDLCESLTSNLRSHFNGASVCFTTESEEGLANVLVPSAERLRFEPAEAAAAVATVKRVCGWDESDAIEIRFRPSGEVIRVSPRLEDGEWVVVL